MVLIPHFCELRLWRRYWQAQTLQHSWKR